MYFQLTNDLPYKDVTFGKLIRGMVGDSNQDAIILFRQHVITIELDMTLQNYTFKCFKRTDDALDYLSCVEEPEVESITIGEVKNLGYTVFKMLRMVYSGLGDFPLDELKLRFVTLVDSYVQVEE